MTFLRMIALSVLLLLGCKSSEEASTTLADGTPMIKKIKSPLIVFNWSPQVGRLEEHLALQIDDAFNGNQKILAGKDTGHKTGLAIMGLGLYVANDPLLSVSYGTELSCLQLRENTEVLLPKDHFRTVVPPARALGGREAVVLYRFVNGLIPVKMGGASSAVIRDRSAIDVRKSRRMSFSSNLTISPHLKPENREFHEKIDARDLKRAEDSLKDGDFCQALTVFENKFRTLYLSLFSAIRALHKFEKEDQYRSYLKSRDLASSLTPYFLNRLIHTSMNSEVFQKIKQNLITNKLLRDHATDVEASATMNSLFMRAIGADGMTDWSSGEIAVVTQIVNEDQTFKLPLGISTNHEFSDRMDEAFDQLISNWVKDNPREFEFSKKLWTYWQERSLSSFVTSDGP